MRMVTAILYYALMFGILHVAPCPYLGVLIKYIFIATLSFVLLYRLCPSEELKKSYFRIPNKIKSALFVAVAGTFLLVYSGTGKGVPENWPLNIFHVENMSGFLGAPIAEELLFRGYLLAAFTSYLFLAKKFFKKSYLPSIAVLITAVLFAMWHIPLYKGFSIVPLLGHFVFGFVLAWLVEYTKSLPSAIVIHMAANSFWLPYS